MTWKKLLAERRVAEEPSSKDDIDNLRQLARRNLKDAAVSELSDDGRFAADTTAFQEVAAYFDACRTRRNVLNYELPEVISSTELEELIDRVAEFEGLVDDWLRRMHPDLV